VLIPERRNGEFILFNRKSNPEKEIWDGAYICQNSVRKNFGADQSFAISEVDKILPSLIANHKNIHSNIDFDSSFHPKITSWLTKSHNLINIGIILHEMRLKKSLSELKIIRKAIEITAMGHLRAMQKCRPKIYEYELEAEILYEFIRLGGSHYAAFSTIVAGGINACTLHYSKNNKKLISGELVLIDAGARYEYYCADVSRTLPINGKFTKKQHIIYEIVLLAQMEVIKQIRPGVSWDQLQSSCERIITLGLADAKVLCGNINTLIAKQKFKPFFMHKIGHWLGLEPHDVGGYSVGNKWRILEPGMIFTVEPGLYIRSLNIGVRIEDNILVTNNGCEILTADIPKNISEIEKIMRMSKLQ
jgi:Xaa-Pro aminopeptidase